MAASPMTARSAGLRTAAAARPAASRGAAPLVLPARRRAALTVRAAIEQPRSASPPRDGFERAVAAPPSTPAPSNPASELFSSIERLVQNTFNSQAPGQRSHDWQEVDGAWVLFPPEGRQPQATVHFLGGAFLGAAPQLSYRLFLEALSNRDVLVIATPYTTNFDHLRIADETQFKFDKALRTLGPDVASLPTYGVGHSLGAVIHLLISCRYTVKREGNAFLSFNNRTAPDVVPFLSPVIAPGARALGPILSSIAASPVRSTVESALDTLRSISPSLLRQVAPLLEQLAPLYLDVSLGREEFTPSPEETQNLIRTYYNIPRNLLLRFRDDSLDDSNGLAALLQGSPQVAEVLDLSVRTLHGDHLRPMQQVIVDLPPDLARLANNIVYAGGDTLGRMASAATTLGVPAATAPLSDLSRNVVSMAGAFGGETGGPLTDGMQSLADEVAAWMGTGSAVLSGGRALPARSVFTDRPAFGAAPPRAPAAAL